VLKGREYWLTTWKVTLYVGLKSPTLCVQAKAASVIGGGESWLAVSRQIDDMHRDEWWSLKCLWVRFSLPRL